MARQPRPSTRSTSRKATRKNPKQRPFADKTPARAQRNVTPEARRQRAGAPKTHPTRSVVASRKDKLPPRAGTAGGARRDLGSIGQMRT